MKTRLDETNHIRRLMGLPILKEQGKLTMGGAAADASTHWDIDVSDQNKHTKLGNHFTYEDLYSKGNKKLYIFKDSLNALDSVIDNWPYTDHPIRLTNQNNPVKSGAYRDPEHNRKSGGVKNSQHVKGRAYDLDVSEMPRNIRLELLKYLDSAGFTGFGHGEWVIHADMGEGGNRKWSYSGYDKPDEKEYRGIKPVNVELDLIKQQEDGMDQGRVEYLRSQDPDMFK